jgi:ParB/RepB/Spo0J family partition protein
MPLTDEFIDLSPASIIWAERYREDLGDLGSLAEHIRQKGLIHPPLVRKRDGRGVCGQRRAKACQMIGLTSIKCRIYHDEGLTDEEAETEILEYEFDENNQRKDTTWRENAGRIARRHELGKKQDSSWTERQTAEKLHLKQPTINDYLKVWRYKHVSAVWEAPQLSTAVNTAKRIEERERAREAERFGLGGPLSVSDQCVSDSNGHTVAESRLDVQHSLEGNSIIRGDFIEWAPNYNGPRFNFLHCDPPYGDDSQESGQGAQHLGHYDDSLEAYRAFCDALERNIDRICTESAHIMFWCSPERYTETAEFLKRLGFKIDGPPLIWNKNNGIAPDLQRRPRRVYEWAIFGWRGDRKLAARGAQHNLFTYSLSQDRIHKHEKPQAMLTYFFGMIVDETTLMLDPTCGSGTSIRAAMTLGAAATLGIEKDALFAEDAQRALTKFEEEFVESQIRAGPMPNGARCPSLEELGL